MKIVHWTRKCRLRSWLLPFKPFNLTVSMVTTRIFWYGHSYRKYLITLLFRWIEGFNWYQTGARWIVFKIKWNYANILICLFMNINEKRKNGQKIQKLFKDIRFLWKVVPARIVILCLNVFLYTPLQYPMCFMQTISSINHVD